MKIKEDIEILVCDNIDELSNQIKHPFDFVLATTVETEMLRKKHNLEPIFVNETNGYYGFVFYLITNKNQNLDEIKQLKDGTVCILSRSENHVPSVWLDKILRDNKLPAKENFFKEIKYDYKAINVVLPVFFKKVNAAIVSKPAFEVLCELNPQILKQVQIIKQSEPILFGVISFDGRNNDEKRKKLIYDTLLSLHTENFGKQLLDLFAVDKLIPFKEEYWQNYLRLYK